MARILIAGCGYVGSALALRLTSAGHTVHGLRRQTGRLPAGIQPVAADLCDPGTLQRLPAGLRYVVYTAAPEGADEDAYNSIYIQGLCNLLRALDEGGQRPDRVILTSSTSVFGQKDGEWIDETSPTEPENYRGRSVLEGEGTLLAGPFPATILRLGGIYGPGRTRLIERVRAGQAQIAEGAPFTNRIHLDDAAGALAHLLSLAEPERLYLGVDHEPARLPKVIRWLAEQTRAALPAVGPDSSTATARESGKRCRNDRLVRSGYVFRYGTFRDGYAAVLASMQQG